MRLMNLFGGPLLLAAALSGAQGQSPCLPSDSSAVEVADLVKALITSTDPDDAALRNTIGLTNVSVSQVSIVTSGTDCTKARQALDALANTPNSSRQMYVIKAGSKRFFVRDPNATAGEHVPVWVFDNKWKFVQVLAGS